MEGEGRGVAEDVGSRQGWESLKKAYAEQLPNRDQSEKMHWYEHQASNRNPRGLDDREAWSWNKEKVNTQLSKLI